MKKTLALSLLLSSLILEAGYKIPNNSINSYALSSANVAHAHGADTTYYNPANMIYNQKKDSIELSLAYVDLEPVSYNSANNVYSIESEKTTSLIPSLHYVSNALNDKGVRVGFSLISPAGLTREWKDMPASASARKYSLRIIELNPTVAIPVTSKLSIGLGFRYLIANGEVKLDGSSLPLNPPASVPYTLNMKGDGEAAGYNLALSYNATESLNFSATYRSKILLNIKGTTDAIFAGAPITSKGSIKAPIPASFIFASAYTFPTDTTVELTYDKTYWSVITETNFEFDNPVLEGSIGRSIPKKWNDTVVYRVGITQELSSMTLMAGFSYSDNAAKDEQYVTFSSPETDFLTYTMGARYKINSNLELGLSALYAQGKERTVSQPTNALGVNGTLGERDIYALNLGVEYKF